MKIMTFEVKNTCNCCEFAEWTDDDDFICTKTDSAILDDNDTCDDWKLEKHLIKDTFWIKKVVK